MSGMASLGGHQELGQLQQGTELMGFWDSNLLRSAGAMDLEDVSLFQVLNQPEKFPNSQSMGQAVMLTAPYKPSGVFFSSEEMGSKNELPGCRWKWLVQPQALLG